MRFKHFQKNRNYMYVKNSAALKVHAAAIFCFKIVKSIFLEVHVTLNKGNVIKSFVLIIFWLSFCQAACQCATQTGQLIKILFRTRSLSKQANKGCMLALVPL